VNGIPMLIPDETARAFGVPRSSKWNAVRRAHLATNPLCAACGRALYPEVHHIEPFHLRPDLELDPDNLITLCGAPGASCHLFFGHLGNWSYWEPAIREVAEAYRDAREVAKIRVHTEPAARPLLGFAPAPTRAAAPDELPVWAHGSGREAMRVWLFVGAFVAATMLFAWLTR